MSERRRKTEHGGAGNGGLPGQSSSRRPDSSERTTPAAAGRDQSPALTGREEAPASAEASQEEEERVEKDIGDLLADVERERDDYLELARRTKADFENYRRRVAGEAREAEKRARAELVRQLLPVVDNLDRALDDEGARRQGGERVDEGFVEGVRLVRDELAGVLKRSGIESYEPKGEEFDPHLHEAMMTRPAASDEAGKVLEVIEKGYRLDGQVLRPARVIVGSAEEEQKPSAGKPANGSEQQPSAGESADGSQAG